MTLPPDSMLRQEGAHRGAPAPDQSD